MRVLGQRCSSCDRQSFEEPEIPMNVGNKILDNLTRHIQNVCYGEGNVPRPQDVHDGHEMHGPHLSSHCEACKMGICSFNKPSFISLQSSIYRQLQSTRYSLHKHRDLDSHALSLPGYFDLLFVCLGVQQHTVDNTITQSGSDPHIFT
ncbi:receptor-transporting protein 4-like [Ascaphus truei]|uniref:receptor-transporting protein 4-like n=1 Tax=Ascaphus truei TaxID=8439 RepID=UPI003F5A1489